MIPKKLHYCWFGPKSKSKVFQECLVSWQQFCPDFEIIEWNESNSKKYANAFYRNALRKKKYAFVADYIRTKVLLNEGGIYLDTDMLLLKPINELLQYDFFTAEEVKGRVAFGLFGATPQHFFLKQMATFYDTNEFNVFSPPVITHTFSPLINTDTVKVGEIIFPPDFFYPLSFENRLEDYAKYITTNSYAVHLWDHSWRAPEKENVFTLINKIMSVFTDFVCYGYSYSYFRRYAKEFLRKLYHSVIGN
ncbi:glycosyltransferase [Flavobacterium enshiense]|uniref:glycosyltransferase n=1 Tax=Flavobacterium enshiense TaxID=1341165 RepID=UPI00345D1C8C